ncbi:MULTISPECIES: ribosome maturation factor RimM [Parabacteroides]|jgi:16S rRNA processing protein RimM|nr:MULTISPECIES: ribosome maturation factor RimM [Parabacteroides]MCA5581342.1 ribosome maturation factor RimM [Parabacteroides gordonii]RGP18387.1 16S rRNA processing protein RimM [Parabacteroides gordonii]
MIKKEEVFKIGMFAKPHGIKGEISLVTNSDVFDDAEDPCVICEIDGILVPFFVEEYRYKTDTVILLKLENVNDEKAAREFTNREAFFLLDAVDEDDLVGDMTWDSFIGYTVIDEHHGELGKITDVDETTINVLLQIDHNGEELLLPAAEELITSADHDNKTLQVSVPEGLLDL